MKSPIVKRSVVIKGHKTSISLEDAFWSELKTIASGQRLTLSALVTTVDDEPGRSRQPLIRVAVLRPLAILLPRDDCRIAAASAGIPRAATGEAIAAARGPACAARRARCPGPRFVQPIRSGLHDLRATLLAGAPWRTSSPSSHSPRIGRAFGFCGFWTAVEAAIDSGPFTNQLRTPGEVAVSTAHDQHHPAEHGPGEYPDALFRHGFHWHQLARNGRTPRETGCPFLPCRAGRTRRSPRTDSYSRYRI